MRRVIVAAVLTAAALVAVAATTQPSSAQTGQDRLVVFEIWGREA
jgi:hypothetical protein